MNKRILATVNVRVIILMVVTLVMVLSWTGNADAQTSRAAQYGSPTAAGEAAIMGSGIDSSAAGSAGVGEVLPSTGGPLLQLCALGAFTLASTGLLVLRSNSR